MVEKSKEVPIPEDLYIKLTVAVYELYKWGVPLREAIKIGRLIVDNYWREKSADKSGC